MAVLLALSISCREIQIVCLAEYGVVFQKTPIYITDN